MVWNCGTYGIVELWPAECQALVDGRRVPLTRREFEILHAFVTCGGHVVAQSRIRWAVWGSTSFPEERDRSVDVYVGKRRRKLPVTVFIPEKRGGNGGDSK